ncbi:MAG: histidine kinase [Roseivirga sp.]|nr:histidine kinase [Roseivirga sp.]
MQIKQLALEHGSWSSQVENQFEKPPALVLNFGHKDLIEDRSTFDYLRKEFPSSTIISCSTSGEIHNTSIKDKTCVATAIAFQHTKTVPILINIKDYAGSLAAGKALVSQFKREGLKFILVLSDGHLVNGSDLVNGMNEELDNEIPISGGLAGDGPDFISTFVGMDENIAQGNVVAIGFYGDRIKINHGSEGGWRQFGPTRTITLSDKNVLYEIDGENALALYKKYLGEHAKNLPGSALFFPLAIETDGREIVRTILNIDEKNNSMIFAGNVPEGAKARLMKANFDRLVDAAGTAAEMSHTNVEGDKLSILISCVGRKLIFGNRIEEELEAAREVLGDETIIAGFYSYGEIAPFSDFMKCELHNQTMTITTISEY